MRSILLVLAACGAPSAPTTTPPPAPPVPASTAIPSLGLRIGCAGTVEMMGEIAMVTCGRDEVSLARFAPARTLDDVIAELRASARDYLESTTTREVRTTHVYRHDHHNHGAAGENYWSDSALEIGGRYYLCLAGVTRSRADADRAGDLCATVTAAP